MLSGAFIALCVGCLMIEHVIGQGPDADGQSSQVDGLSVLNMGRNYNNPLLRLIGTAMRNSKQDILEIICPLIRCGEWTVWSACTATVQGQFGRIKRSRECGRSYALCNRNDSQKIYQETDSRVCMGDIYCPIGFNKTENGFCFLFHEDRMTWTEADKFCRDKGAFLVDVNSKLKNDEVRRFASKNCNGCNNMCIDGHRKDVNSPWEYSYKHAGGHRNYSNWHDGQPENTASELYMGYDIRNGKLRDLSDFYFWEFVCEYIK